MGKYGILGGVIGGWARRVCKERMQAGMQEKVQGARKEYREGF